jgi:hypothetical protein
MRTVTAFLILTFAFTTISQAQITRFEKGDLDISAGVGLIPTFAADGGNTLVPPLSLRLDYRPAENFSIGAYAAFSSTETKYFDLPDDNLSQWQNDFFIVGLRGAAHGSRFENWDIYGGFMVGYNIASVSNDVIAEEETKSEEGPSFRRPAENNFTFSGFVGATYFPKKNLGIFGELGYCISILNFGVTYKINGK